MKNESRPGLSVNDRHIPGSNDRIFCIHRGTDRPSDHLPVSEINNDDQVDPSLYGKNVSDVRHPCSNDLTRLKLALQQIGRDPKPMLRIGGMDKFRLHVTSQMVLLLQSGRFGAGYRHPFPRKALFPLGGSFSAPTVAQAEFLMPPQGI